MSSSLTVDISSHPQPNKLNETFWPFQETPPPPDLMSVFLMGEPYYWELVMYGPKWD